MNGSTAPDAPTAPAAGTGRIVLLTTSHRVAPGMLSWPAWQELRTAHEVLCADPGHVQLPYLREAGVEVRHEVPSARELVERCAGGRTVVVLTAGEGDRALTDGLAALAGSGRVDMPDLELLPGSYDLPGARLLDLVQIMDRIRRECPWSSQQTHESLAKYGIEEAYELVDAIEQGDRAELREELGDVLLQVVFHARIAEEGLPDAEADDPDLTDDGSGSDGDSDAALTAFSIDDVAGGIVAKLVHRHPHIFGDATAETPEEVRAHWMRAKAEAKQRTSVTEGVPLGQPALALAAKLATRAQGAGLDVPLPSPDGPGGGLGHQMLALAVKAGQEGADPEAALRAAARAYRDAVVLAEKERGAGE